MRYLRSAVLALLVSLAVATPARSQTTLFSGTYTGGSNFATTASVSLAYSAVSAGVYLFQLNVTNLGQTGLDSNPYIFGEVYKAIGLFNLPKAFSLLASSSSLAGWTVDKSSDLNGDGLVKATTAYVSPDPAPQNGLQVGSAASFSFTIGGFAGYDPTAVGAGIHAIAGPTGCSTKLGVQGGSVVRDGPYDDATCSPVVTPEPAGILLVGTGLLGILGIGFVRRRRGSMTEHTA